MISSVAHPQSIVVAGNGMVGNKFCEKLVAKAQPGACQITVFGGEPRPAYDRVHLSAYFSGTTAEELSLAPLSWYEQNSFQHFVNTSEPDPTIRFRSERGQKVPSIK
jgi:nitrite reductase (NADH) large subunit